MLDLGQLGENDVYYFVQLLVSYYEITLLCFFVFVQLRFVVDLVDDVILNVLGDGPFPECNVFPDVFILNQLE